MIEKDLAEAFKTAGPIPEGYDRDNPPESGFVDEPEVYEEAHVVGVQSEEITLVIDPATSEVVAVLDLPETKED